MSRWRGIAWTFTACGFLCGALDVRAQEPRPSSEAKSPAPPKGLRILNSGDSWHRFMPDYLGRLGKAAGLEGQSVRWSGRPEEIAELLAKGELDVMSWGRPGWSSGQLTEFLRQNVLENGLQGNPDFRLYVQMAWMVHDGLGRPFQSKDDYDRSKLADVQAVLDRERAKVEKLADELNAKHGRRVVFLVPLGDAATKLRAMIVDGRFPGVTKQSALFSDAMPHAGPIAAELAAYCNYAAVYRRSPVGLKIKDGVPEEQRAILQQIAWDMVSKYPYAGIAKPEVPRPPTEGEQSVPKPGTGAAAAPDALKRRKETQDLPAESVVADYNDDIEKLPQAERPGVSNVKYYVDDAGRSAVAVLVHVGDAQWTHLLVYDEQHRRTGATKRVADR